MWKSVENDPPILTDEIPSQKVCFAIITGIIWHGNVTHREDGSLQWSRMRRSRLEIFPQDFLIKWWMSLPDFEEWRSVKNQPPIFTNFGEQFKVCFATQSGTIHYGRVDCFNSEDDSLVWGEINGNDLESFPHQHSICWWLPIEDVPKTRLNSFV